MNNSSTLKSHVCNEKCKGRSNYATNCYSCNKTFYTKCFAIDAQLHTKIIKDNYFIRFICGPCQATPKQRRTLSTSSTNIGNPPPVPASSTTISNDTHQLNDNMKLIIDKLSTISSMQTPNISSTTTTTGEDDSINKNINEILTMLNNMYSLTIKSHDKIQKLHTIDNEKDSLKILTSSMEKIKNDQPKKTDNINLSKLNDWSMHFDTMNCSLNTSEGRPSLVVQQSLDSDVLSILRNAESRTWDTLDIIMKKLNDQSTKIDSLLLQNKTENVLETSVALDMCKNFHIASPLVNTIDLDTTVAQLVSLDIDDASIQQINIADSLTDSLIEAPQSTWNPNTTEKPTKEAIAHENYNENENEITQNVPESSKTNGQKSQSTIPSGDGLGNGCDNDERNQTEIGNESESHRTIGENEPATDSTDKSLTSNENIVRQIIDQMDYEDLLGTMIQPTTHKTNNFHISPFPTSRNEEHIKEFLTRKGIPNEAFEIKRLVGHKYNMSTLTFVSFKVSCTEEYANKISAADFWPETIKISPFTPREKHAVNVGQNNNFMERNCKFLTST